MLNAVGHGVSVRAAQRDVQHHDLIGSNESGDTHDKDQIPAREHERTALDRRLLGSIIGYKRTTDSLADQRNRKGSLRHLLSNKEEEDSLSQQDRDGHSQLLSSSCEGTAKA